MKVLLINKFHYLRGGAESVYFNTKKVLEEKGHTVICFSMQDERNEPCQQDKFFVKNVDFENNGKWFSKALRYLYYPQAKSKLEQLIIEEEPDIAHLHNISHHLTNSILKPLNKLFRPCMIINGLLRIIVCLVMDKSMKLVLNINIIIVFLIRVFEIHFGQAF